LNGVLDTFSYGKHSGKRQMEREAQGAKEREESDRGDIM
jgi:hypothetical protein